MKKPTIHKILKSYVNITICVAFFCSIFGKTALAKQNLLQKHRIELKKIENYLNNIKNLSSDFIQTSQGQYVSGKFYLSRPGKMRIEYDSQPPVLITVNGSVLTYKDLELDETSNLSTNTTPASLLTRKNISFAAKDVKLIAFNKSKNFTSVTILKKNRPEAGKFRLTFQNQPLDFVKMEVIDNLEQKTSIQLKNTTFPEKLSRKLFIIKNKNLAL